MIPAFPGHGKPHYRCVLASDMAFSANSHAISGLAPGASGPLLALADRCVQCGLCLPHCPTYQLDRNEAESPRGRIALARALADGSLPATTLADAHLDHCLGCRRCEPVCPAGVEYGALLLEFRQQGRLRRSANWKQKTIEWMTARPRLLDRLLGLYRGLYPLLPKLLPRPPARRAPIKASPRVPAAENVSLFRGCIARRYDTDAHDALGRLCAAAGVTLIAPAAQTCCGALHAHCGNADAAAALAARNLAAFTAGIPVLTTATGCHESLAHSLAGHAPVRDAAEFLWQHANKLRFRPANRRVALHLPCTQRAVAHSDFALRALLGRIPALTVIELPDTGCCGAAGMHMLEFPDRARQLRQPLMDALAATGADTLLSANVGCRLHLQNGLAQAGTHDNTTAIRHPLEFLAEYLDTDHA
jgi:glycolate oxidase iron-sulfur subunit